MSYLRAASTEEIIHVGCTLVELIIDKVALAECSFGMCDTIIEEIPATDVQITAQIAVSSLHVNQCLYSYYS
jgi:hypothetical protein